MNLLTRAFFVAFLFALSTARTPADPIVASHPNKMSTAQPQMPNASSQTVDLSQPLTLDQAIRIALQNQNTIGIALSRLDAARAGVTVAQSAYYPQIAPTYQYTSQVSTFNNGMGGTATSTVNQGITQIGLQQLIFDMGKRELTVAQSRDTEHANQFAVLDARQTVIVNVSTSYYDLLRQKELVRVAQASVNQNKSTLDLTKASADVGTIAKKDILQAEANYDNAQVQLLQAQNNVKIAQTTLKNAMGVLTIQPILTPDTPLPPPPTQPDTRTAADYLKTALDNRPDLKEDLATIDANRRGVRIADINAGLLIQANINEGYRIDPDPGENRLFTATFSYPLFDAGLTRAQAREAKDTLKQSQQELELARQAVQLAVDQAYLTRENARQQISATQSAVTAAQANYDSAEASLQVQVGTIVDVITAQAALVTAETNAVQAIYDFYTADAQLQRALGQNDPYLPKGKKP